MTLVSCNRKTESSAKSLELNEITTSCATPRNDKNLSCHRDVLAEVSQEKIPQQVRDDKSHFPRPQGRGKKGEGLLHRPDSKILKRVQDDRVLSEAHSKELNVLTSYRLNDFKKKAGATHVDMSARNNRYCRSNDYSDFIPKNRRYSK